MDQKIAEEAIKNLSEYLQKYALIDKPKKYYQDTLKVIDRTIDVMTEI